MENNKLLLGVKFINSADEYTIQLVVPFDLTLKQLLMGIYFGLEDRKNDSDSKYKKCLEIFEKFYDKNGNDDKTYKSFIVDNIKTENVDKKNYVINIKDKLKAKLYKRIAEETNPSLGFITGTLLIFSDSTRSYEIKAYNTDSKARIDLTDVQIKEYPKHNISSRKLNVIDTTPVKIISPTQMPKKPKVNLGIRILSSLVMLGAMVLFAVFGSSRSMEMLLMSIIMSATAVFTAVISILDQFAEYNKNKKEWKTQYETYIHRVIKDDIKARQAKDIANIDSFYPNMTKLVVNTFGLSSDIFSRVQNDDDFMHIRLGISQRDKNQSNEIINGIKSFFEIEGEKKDPEFSPTKYEWRYSGESIDILFEPEKKPNFIENQPKILKFFNSLFEFIKRRSKHDNGDLIDEERYQGSSLFLCNLPYEISEKYKYLEEAPVLLSLKDCGTLGVVSKENFDSVIKLANNFVFELSFYQSPSNVQFVMLLPDDCNKAEEYTLYFKYLPHFLNLLPKYSQFINSKQYAQNVFSQLYDILGKRKEEKGNNSDYKFAHIVVIVYEEYNLKEHPIAHYLPKAPKQGEPYKNDLGITFIFCKNYENELPEYCGKTIVIENETLKLFSRSNKNEIISIYNSMSVPKDFDNAFKIISALFYIKIAKNGAVPSYLSLNPLLKNNDQYKDLSENWDFKKRKYDVTKTLAVPIGDKGDGTVFLDLHEKADGPHMLVAGTTGSGKSQTIISYLLGLCYLYSPEELNLLLVDMKGGGFINRLFNKTQPYIPHVVGAVTDVAGDENGTGAEYMLKRFLSSLTAEIKRRKIYFNKAKVDNIDSYITKYRERKDNNSDNEKLPQLAHLVLVIDEFTELKRFSQNSKDVNFIDEITTIARVGRSLGFHIILISQNIQGAITEDINVNSKARLCLKVATIGASKDMLGTIDAAAPDMPGNGRAYLKVGTGSRYEYFQSAYSGARSEISDDDTPFSIQMVELGKEFTDFFDYREKLKKDQDEELKNLKNQIVDGGNHVAENKKIEDQIAKLKKIELEDYVEEIYRAYNSSSEYLNAIPSIPFNIFSDPLYSQFSFLINEDKIYYRNSKKDDWKEENVAKDITMSSNFLIKIGKYDDPLNQRQDVFIVDLLKNNIIVFGTSASGKTTLIKNVLVQLNNNLDESEEEVYLLDFGGSLSQYKNLPILCACFEDTIEENIKAFFKRFENKLKDNVAELKGSPYSKDSEIPHSTLIIENINAFLADKRFDKYQDLLLKICRDGRTKGITVILTASENSGGVNRYLSSFEQKIALVYSNENLRDLFGGGCPTPYLTPGRGVASIDNMPLEFQCFLPFKEDANSSEINYLDTLKNAEQHKNRIKIFDGDLMIDNFKKFYKVSTDFEKLDISKNPVVGLSYYNMDLVDFDYKNIGAIAIYGRKEYGKTNLLRLIVETLARNDYVKFVLLDDGRKELDKIIQYIRANNIKNQYTNPNELVVYLNAAYQLDDEVDMVAEMNGIDTISVKHTLNKITKKEQPVFVQEDKPYPEQWDSFSEEAKARWEKHNKNQQPIQSHSSKEQLLNTPNQIIVSKETSTHSIVKNENNAFFVFIIQNRSVYLKSNKELLNTIIPKIISDYPSKCLFIFSDARNFSENDGFFDCISTVFLLDDVYDFVSSRRSKTALIELDDSELKDKFAKIDVGDGYVYNKEIELLQKVKFIKHRDTEIQKTE